MADVDFASSIIRALEALLASALVVFKLLRTVPTEVQRRVVRILAGVSRMVRFLSLIIAVTVNRVITAPLVFILLRSSCRTGRACVRLVLTLLMVACRLLARANGSWLRIVVSNLLG